MKSVLLAFAVFAIATRAAAPSRDDPSLGTWKLNVAKSTFTPGPPIKGDTRIVSADGKTMTIEQRSTDDLGRPSVNLELFERQ